MKSQGVPTNFGERLLLVVSALAAGCATCALLLMAYSAIDGQASPSETLGFSAFICACSVGAWGLVRTLLYLFTPATSGTPALQFAKKLALLPIGLAVVLYGIVLLLAGRRG